MAEPSKNKNKSKTKKPSQAVIASRKAENPKLQQENRRELIGIVFIIAALFSIVCWVNTEAFLLKPLIAVIGGTIGQVGRYLLPVALVYTGMILFRSKGRPVVLRSFCALTLLITLSALIHIVVELFTGNEYTLSLSQLYADGQTWKCGGAVAGFLAELLTFCLTKVGAILVLLILIALQVLACMRITVSALITAIKKRPRVPQKAKKEEKPVEDPAEKIVNKVAQIQIDRYNKKHPVSDFDLPVEDPLPLAGATGEGDEEIPEKKEKTAPKRTEGTVPEKLAELPIVDAEKQQVTIDEIELSPEPPAEAPPEKMKKGEAEATAAEISQEIEKNIHQEPPAYVFPGIELLNIRKQGSVDATGEMKENAQRLSETLQSFGIAPHIVDVIRGPSVTRYELELEKGVKLAKITNLANDIALSLGAASVRISAIPDKISVVGIEVPNKAVHTVFAREVIDSKTFAQSKSKTTFAVGKDISGNCIVGDISKLPHMLIAGTTGSGKSVCTNTLIISLLYKAKPEEVKMIMVDPKMVELGIYNGIPHLLIPVVTDPKKAAGALQWTVTEMMRRYRLMSDAGVRDLESYNKVIAHEPDQEPMPQIVVVIDELADLMLVAAKDVEESICRIAQMGRASGIHLIIATQRPSADVITGLMKANIPSRIAFAVSSAMESRIILDTQGAEKLVGRGDMLYAPHGQGKPQRVQGCYISDEEVQAVISSIKAQTGSDYSMEIMEQIEKKAEQSGKNGGSGGETVKSVPDADEGDELLPAAVEVLLESGQASVSMLQRRLKLGFARAARIMDEMEEKGIVGPYAGSKTRQLLITKEQWEQMQNGGLPDPPVEEEIP